MGMGGGSDFGFQGGLERLQVSTVTREMKVNEGWSGQLERLKFAGRFIEAGLPVGSRPAGRPGFEPLAESNGVGEMGGQLEFNSGERTMEIIEVPGSLGSDLQLGADFLNMELDGGFVGFEEGDLEMGLMNGKGTGLNAKTPEGPWVQLEAGAVNHEEGIIRGLSQASIFDEDSSRPAEAQAPEVQVEIASAELLLDGAFDEFGESDQVEVEQPADDEKSRREGEQAEGAKDSAASGGCAGGARWN